VAGLFLIQVATKTEAGRAAAGPIDLSTTGLFPGNAFRGGGWTSPQGGTWSGTITPTHEVGSGGSAYSTWSGGEPFAGDKNGNGVSNGMAFLPGAANPSENATGRLPAVSQSGGSLVMEFDCLAARTRRVRAQPAVGRRSRRTVDQRPGSWDSHTFAGRRGTTCGRHEPAPVPPDQAHPADAHPPGSNCRIPGTPDGEVFS
jgi:hypothetical protein